MTLTTVLFAGGKSRRMGVEKATLPFAGEPLWSRQLNVLRELKPEALWISARSRPGWCPAEIDVVLDAPPARGPLSGLAAVLGRLQTSHVLALAVDLPDMTADHLRDLWKAARPGCGVIPVNESFFEPLCAIYPVEAATEAAQAGDGSLQNLAQRLVLQNRAAPYALTTRERRLYRNLNTPEDLAEG